MSRSSARAPGSSPQRARSSAAAASTRCVPPELLRGLGGGAGPPSVSLRSWRGLAFDGMLGTAFLECRKLMWHASFPMLDADVAGWSITWACAWGGPGAKSMYGRALYHCTPHPIDRCGIPLHARRRVGLPLHARRRLARTKILAHGTNRIGRGGGKRGRPIVEPQLIPSPATACDAVGHRSPRARPQPPCAARPRPGACGVPGGAAGPHSHKRFPIKKIRASCPGRGSRERGFRGRWQVAVQGALGVARHLLWKDRVSICGPGRCGAYILGLVTCRISFSETGLAGPQRRRRAAAAALRTGAVAAHLQHHRVRRGLRGPHLAQEP
eukprot:gene6423-biopygen11885